MKRILLLLFISLLPFSAKAQFSSEVKTIEIGLLSTTHVIFTSDLTYVDISRQEWVAYKSVPASKNVLALKAKVEFDQVTTITVLEANGTIHTFQVKYNAYPEQLLFDTRVDDEGEKSSLNTQERPTGTTVVQKTEDDKASGGQSVLGASVPTVMSHEPVQGVNVTSVQSSNFSKYDAPTLQEIMLRPQEIFHIGAKNFRIEAYCTNIFVYSDFIYIVIAIENGSDIGFEAGDAQFSIETQTKKKKFLESEKDVWAKSSYGTLSCAPRGRTLVGYTIPKFTLLKNEALRIYIYENKGSRNLVLTLKDKDINYAVSPFGK